MTTRTLALRGRDGWRLAAAVQSPAASTGSAPPPRLLSETGLYADRATARRSIRANRPFSPQYPLWTDGARKSRWVRLPAGSDDRRARRRPVGLSRWARASGRSSRSAAARSRRGSCGKDGPASWTFASYVWNEAQTDAELAPADGVPNVAEVAPGKRHSIPSREDCRACHDSARTEILGFTALQLSTDRDPLAPHAEPLAPGMVTLQTLVDERLLAPARPELVARAAAHCRRPTRARARCSGYLSANCGACHNAESSIASLGLSC